MNRHGGDARVVELPDAGLHGNSHFMFAKKNNVEVADLLSKWLAEKGLDAFESEEAEVAGPTAPATQANPTQQP